MKKDFIEALKAMDLTPGQVKSCADLYTACFESVQPLYEMKDTLTFGDADTKGKRVGKSDRNIELARYKSKHPVTVRFHRTAAGNVDSILNTGLKTQNDNYGRNTGDANAYDPVVWTSLNPDNIPVLRKFDKKEPILRHKAIRPHWDEKGNWVEPDEDDEDIYEYPYNPPARYRSNIDTLKLTFDKDKYNKMDRRWLPNGRKSAKYMKKVGEGESSVSHEGPYKIDVFGEDIGKENISLMKKEDENVIREIENFIAWVVDADGHRRRYSTTFNQVKKFLPSYLLNSISSLIEQWKFFRVTEVPYVLKVNSGNFHVPFDKLKWVMQETSKCIAQHPYRISSSRFKERTSGVDYPISPDEVVEIGYVPPKSNRPWMGEELEGRSYVKAAKGHISRSVWDTRDINRDKRSFTDKMYDAPIMNVLHSDDAIQETPHGAIRKYNSLYWGVGRFIKDLHDESISMFKPCLDSFIHESIQRMMHNGGRSDDAFFDGIEEFYTKTKNSDVYEKWHTLRDELFEDNIKDCGMTSDTKRNILKQILYKRYTFKWAFCAGMAGDTDKWFDILQTKLQYV